MPPSKPVKKVSPEQKRIAELEKKLLDQSKTIGTISDVCGLIAVMRMIEGNLEKRIEKAKNVAPIRNLIPKPPGQAGRTGGYKLASEVQLPVEHYTRILVSLVDNF
jgi:uncharacterized coiled-coil protein SlyX